MDEVVTGMMQCDGIVPIGYIPAGSTNDFAQSLKIPKNMLQAADVAVNGTGISMWIVGVFNEDYLYYTINNDVFDIAFDVSAFTNYNTGDIRYSKGGINVERNDISESDYEAYINELKPIEWKKLP